MPLSFLFASVAIAFVSSEEIKLEDQEIVMAVCWP